MDPFAIRAIKQNHSKRQVHPTGTAPHDGTLSIKPANQQTSVNVAGSMVSGAKVVPTTASTSGDLHSFDERPYQGAIQHPPPMQGRVEEASLRCELKEHDGTNRSSVSNADGEGGTWREVGEVIESGQISSSPAPLPSFGIVLLSQLSQKNEREITEEISTMKKDNLFVLITHLQQAVDGLENFNAGKSSKEQAQLRTKLLLAIKESFQRYQTFCVRTDIFFYDISEQRLAISKQSPVLSKIKEGWTSLTKEEYSTREITQRAFLHMLSKLSDVGEEREGPIQWMTRIDAVIRESVLTQLVSIFEKETAPTPYSMGGIYGAPLRSEQEANKAILKELKRLLNPKEAAIEDHPSNLGRTYLGITQEQVQAAEEERKVAAAAAALAQKEKIETKAEKLERELSDDQKIAALKGKFKENPLPSNAEAFDQINLQNPNAILIKEGTNLPESEMIKSKNPFVRLYRWWNRTEETKAIYQEGITATRKYVEAKYGPYAAIRFDKNFALRYRTGSPLTVRALNQFLAYEKRLYRTDVIIIDLQQAASFEEFSSSTQASAVAEFQERYYQSDSTGKRTVLPANITEEEHALLFADFYRHYLQRAVVIMPSRKKTSSIEKGFFSARWNAFRRFLFPGARSTESGEAREALSQWVYNRSPFASKELAKEKAEALLKKIKDHQFSLDDVEEVMKEAQETAIEENTWFNFFYYGVYKPIVGGVAMGIGAAAGAAMITNETSFSRGGAKAALLAAGLWAAEKQPGTQLMIALSGLWAANNPKMVNSGGDALFHAGGKIIKYGLTLGAAHFFPLILCVMPFI